MTPSTNVTPDKTSGSIGHCGVGLRARCPGSSTPVSGPLSRLCRLAWGVLFAVRGDRILCPGKLAPGDSGKCSRSLAVFEAAPWSDSLIFYYMHPGMAGAVFAGARSRPRGTQSLALPRPAGLHQRGEVYQFAGSDPVGNKLLRRGAAPLETLPFQLEARMVLEGAVNFVGHPARIRHREFPAGGVNAPVASTAIRDFRSSPSVPQYVAVKSV